MKWNFQFHFESTNLRPTQYNNRVYYFTNLSVMMIMSMRIPQQNGTILNPKKEILYMFFLFMWAPWILNIWYVLSFTPSIDQYLKRFFDDIFFSFKEVDGSSWFMMMMMIMKWNSRIIIFKNWTEYKCKSTDYLY